MTTFRATCLAVVSFMLVYLTSIRTANSDIVTLGAIADSFVEFGDVDDLFANHGSEDTIDIERFSIFTDWAILIQFDVSAIPTGATINSATLSLSEGDRIYAHGSGGALDFFELSNVTESWDELTVNGDTMPSYDLPVVTIAADPNPSASIGFYVDEWVNGGVNNFGLFIQNTGFNHSGNFVSREGSVVADRPSLIVDFTPIPEPSGIGMLLIALIFASRCRRYHS